MHYLKYLKGQYLILILCFVLLILHKNKKWGGPTEPWNNICSDGRGYYAWLPATFIYHDLSFGFFYTTEKDEQFMPNKGCYQPYLIRTGHAVVNKYYPGTALCMLPFFATAHLYALITGTYEANGYTAPYFVAIGLAALCWLYVGLFFLWSSLGILQITNLVKTLTCTIIILGSNAIYFSVDTPSYSHIYSFGLITIFIWASLQFYKSGKTAYLYLMAAFLGWIFITRPVNLSILLFIPFLLGKRSAALLSDMRRQPLKLLVLGLCALVCPTVLFVLYKLGTGSYFVYSYGKEGFDFLHPHLLDFFWSYDNGILLYVPAIVLPFISVYWHGQQPWSGLMYGLLACLASTIYIHASWWYWSYASSFGPRTMLDFLAAFGILIALGLSTPHKKLRVLQYIG
ncbi:MAG TPA: hypothetical protein VL947_08570, partial [Cytophagales bacterium]|nr:hypothetical protein [Cytophagales bacterium]